MIENVDHIIVVVEDLSLAEQNYKKSLVLILYGEENTQNSEPLTYYLILKILILSS